MKAPKLSSPYILTADIGGSHITAAICDISNNSLMKQSIVRVELNSKDKAERILKAWESALKGSMLNGGVNVSALSIAMPGPFDYDKGISYIKGLNKYESIYGMNIKQYLSDTLRFDPGFIKFRNDAEATIAGEVRAGVGKGYRSVLGVTLGTGFGSAYCYNKITKDIDLSSEVFKNTIADDYLSTRWFLKRYYDLSGMNIANVKDLAEVAETSGIARDIFKEFATNMSEFLKEPLARIVPDVLIISGNISKASRLFLPFLKTKVTISNIRVAQLGESAALIGAAGLFEATDNSMLFKTIIN